MIQIDNVVTYLRASLTSGPYIVGAAASLAVAKDNSRLMVGEGSPILPTMFVMLGKFVNTTLAPETFLQEYDERLDIIICLDNQSDRTGQSAQQIVYQTRIDLYSLLANYLVDPNCHTLQPVGDQMADMDRARYWHRFEFSCKGRLDSTDGYQPNLDNLNEVTVDYNNPVDETVDNPMAQDDFKNLNP